jgi:hypothetical protein
MLCIRDIYIFIYIYVIYIYMYIYCDIYERYIRCSSDWWRHPSQSSAYCYTCVRTLLHMGAFGYLSSVLILLHICPHTAVYVSSYCCVCVLILLHICPHTAVYVSSYCCVCVLILLCMCPHTAVYVSSYCCTSVAILLHF